MGSYPLKVSKLTGNDSRETCFTNTEGNLKRFLYSLPLHRFCGVSLKDATQYFEVATASHTSLALKKYRQQVMEASLYSHYRWGVLLLQNSGTTAGHVGTSSKLIYSHHSYLMKYTYTHN